MGIVLLKDDDQNIRWRYLVLIGVGVSIIQFIGMHFLPDSPRWLANKNRSSDALKCLRLVYKPAFVHIY